MNDHPFPPTNDIRVDVSRLDQCWVSSLASVMWSVDECGGETGLSGAELVIVVDVAAGDGLFCFSLDTVATHIQ